MLNVPNSVLYNYHRVCELQRVLADHEPPVGACAAADMACRCAATGGQQPAFLPPAEPLNLTSIFSALRNHYDGEGCGQAWEGGGDAAGLRKSARHPPARPLAGTEHDAYLQRNPAEPWRPVAVRSTGCRLPQLLPCAELAGGRAPGRVACCSCRPCCCFCAACPRRCSGPPWLTVGPPACLFEHASTSGSRARGAERG